jgi:hypothetical protein
MMYHTNSSGPDMIALKAAFKKCGELSQKGKHLQVGLAVPTKGNLYGIISDVIGEDATTILQRKNKLDLKGITIHLITDRIKPKSFRGPVLAAYTTIDLIKKMVRAGYATDIVFVPWLEEELAVYLSLYDSQEFEIEKDK